MSERRPSRSASPLLVIAAVALACAILGGIGVGILAASMIVTRPAPAASAPVAVDWPAVVPPPLERQTAVSPIVPAPPLRLVDQAGKPFDLGALRGSQVLVFFGYTHCPDVCPTTLADARDALARSPTKFRVIFVTIDPARDDAPTLARYLGYYDAGFIGLTGTADQVRAAADAWGVQYARLDSDPAGGYAMAHTADAFLVDAQGRLRHRIWFGAGPEVMADRVARLAAEPAPSAEPVASVEPGTTAAHSTPTPAATATLPSAASTPAPGATSGTPVPPPRATPTAATGVVPVLQTTVIRAGMNRLVVTTSDPNNRELAWPDATAHVTFRSTGDPAAPPIEADALQIWISVGTKGAWVVDAAFPAPGAYTATISLARDGAPVGSATFGFSVRDHGSTPAVGDPAPSIRTPTAADWNGVLANITTDVFPDPRFYQESVDQLLAGHRPFVLTFYSPAYCPTTACGPLLKNMKKIADEFPGVTFVHVEPHVMTNYGNRLVPDWSSGDLRFNDAAQAYGIPVEPFVFVVDANGRIAASFELIVGMDEIRAAIHAAIGS